MSKVKKTLDTLNQIIIFILIIITIVLVSLAIFQVGSRYVFNFSYSWVEELSRYLFIWISMLAASVLVKEKSHASIVIFKDKLSKKRRRAVDILVSVISMIFLSFLFYQGLMMTIQTAGQVSPAAHLPINFVYASLPFGAFLMLIYYLEHIINDLMNSGGLK